MSEPINLRDCPFCGGEAEFERWSSNNEGTQVWCKTCHCRSPWIYGYYETSRSEQEKSAAAWNRRVADRYTELMELADRMAKVLSRVSEFASENPISAKRLGFSKSHKALADFQAFKNKEGK